MSVAEDIRKEILLRAAFASKSLDYFLDAIVIPSSPEPMRFGACADNWQREMIAPQVPAIEHLAGRNPDYRGPLRFMNILARGHNKSSFEAWVASYLVAYSKRRIEGYVLAADRDQGRLIVKAARDLLELNPWIPVSITKDTLVGPGGEIEVLPRDAKSAMGLRGNFYIADEYVHWSRQDEWTALVSGLRKITPTVFCVISNAGLRDSWQHEAYLSARDDPEWSVFHREGTLATWMTADGIAKDRLLLPPSEADRLIGNIWIDPAAEFDYLRRPEVARCERLGAALGLDYRLRRQIRVSNYVAAIDYGPKRDRTVLVVLHLRADGVVVIDRLDVWQGSTAEHVPVARVEAWIEDVQKSFAPVAFVLDPYQMEGTIQWAQAKGLPAEGWSARAGQGNFKMAQCLRALVALGQIAWYPGAGNLDVTDKRTGRVTVETLADELVGLRVKKMPYGFRFDHEQQKHDDRAVAITMAAVRAIEYQCGESKDGSIRIPERKAAPTEHDKWERADD